MQAGLLNEVLPHGGGDGGHDRVDFTNSRNLIIAAVILVCGLGFSGGLTFEVGGALVTLRWLLNISIQMRTWTATVNLLEICILYLQCPQPGTAGGGAAVRKFLM